MGIWVELSFTPGADVARALDEGDVSEPLALVALSCGMRQAQWSRKEGVVTVSDAELRSASAWDPFLERLRNMGIPYDEVYEADGIGAVYTERWRPGMDRTISAPRVEGDDAVTLRDLAAVASECTSATELLVRMQHHVGADLPPLAAYAGGADGHVVLHLHSPRRGRTQE